MTKNVIHKLSLGIVTTTDYGYISIDRKASFEQKNRPKLNSPIDGESLQIWIVGGNELLVGASTHLSRDSLGNTALQVVVRPQQSSFNPSIEGQPLQLLGKDRLVRYLPIVSIPLSRDSLGNLWLLRPNWNFIPVSIPLSRDSLCN